MIPRWVQTLTIIQAIAVAGVSVLLGMFVLRRGLLNALTWIVALGALGIAAINKLSY